ncbi:hypothetical protein D3C77_328820 [compost metagenome]
MMGFNQITFQNECFHITCRNNVFEIADFRNKPLRFTVMTARKIRADAVFQHFGFTDINDRSLVVFHQIAARQVGKKRKLMADIVHRLFLILQLLHLL